MCRKQKSISAVKTESSHSHCKKLYCTADSFKAPQTALMHSRQLDCTAEGSTAESFTAQQKALMHNKQLQCTTESFTVQQEALSHSRKLYCTVESFATQQKKVNPAAETGEKKKTSTAETEDKHHILPAVSVLLADETQFAHKPDQIELQLDRSQLPYLEYLDPIPQEAAQPTLTTKRLTINIIG